MILAQEGTALARDGQRYLLFGNLTTLLNSMLAPCRRYCGPRNPGSRRARRFRRRRHKSPCRARSGVDPASNNLPINGGTLPGFAGCERARPAKCRVNVNRSLAERADSALLAVAKKPLCSRAGRMPALHASPSLLDKPDRRLPGSGTFSRCRNITTMRTEVGLKRRFGSCSRCWARAAPAEDAAPAVRVREAECRGTRDSPRSQDNGDAHRRQRTPARRCA